MRWKIHHQGVDHLLENITCAMIKSRVFLGMGNLPPLIGILISWVYKPLRNWVDEFIPYYMEIMGVDRPWHTYELIWAVLLWLVMSK